jgi:hypothetical protein
MNSLFPKIPVSNSSLRPPWLAVRFKFTGEELLAERLKRATVPAAFIRPLRCIVAVALPWLLRVKFPSIQFLIGGFLIYATPASNKFPSKASCGLRPKLIFEHRRHAL